MYMHTSKHCLHYYCREHRANQEEREQQVHRVIRVWLVCQDPRDRMDHLDKRDPQDMVGFPVNQEKMEKREHGGKRETRER